MTTKSPSKTDNKTVENPVLASTTPAAEPAQRVLTVGLPDLSYCDNVVTTSKYTWWSFLPVAIGEQFRRKGNVYFLVMGCMMAIGYYTEYFDSSISPWTTLGPLALVIGISIAQEGVSDIARHRSDDQSNKHPCTVLSLEGRTPYSTPFLTSLSSKENSKNSKNNSKDTAVDFTKSVKILPSVTKEEARVNIDFHTVKRCDLRVGQLILIKNREMIPCDLVLLASSNENGGAYIETSGIDGETNLKLRNSAKPLKPLASSEKRPITSSALSGRRKYFQGFTTSKVEELPDENVESPKKGQKAVSPSKSFDDNKISFEGEGESLHKRSSSMPVSAPISPPTKSDGQVDKKEQKVSKSNLPSKSRFDAADSKYETLEEATARLAQCTALGFPNGKQATCLTDVPLPPPVATTPSVLPSPGILRHIRNVSFDQFESVRSVLGNVFNTPNSSIRNNTIASRTGENYVAVVTCELPNASVHTFNGKLTLPPTVGDERHAPMEVSLSAENFLLRGAFLRNTEWAIGVACFTGPDTKLVKNSSAAPSRMSQLDQLVNRTIMIIIAVMMTFVLALSIGAMIVTNRDFNNLWYLGYSTSGDNPWPYLLNLQPPNWEDKANNLLQNMFLFTTLLNNFVPLSLYVTMELVTRALMMLINTDLNMYHSETDTPANSRSTIVTDLGQVKYIFSDKTGTLTQNVMRFKRCSVDGILFGSPVVKSAPVGKNTIETDKNLEIEPVKSFHPLKKLIALFAGVPKPMTNNSLGIQNNGSTFLTFNTEMFLRVMSICHTVVVEKDYDAPDDDPIELKQSRSWSSFRGKKSKAKKSTEKRDSMHPGIIECFSNDMQVEEGMSKDGAPLGQSYQAESPDEGALVSAASLLYGFQLVSRSASGLRIACSSPSLLQSPKICKELKSGKLTAKKLATVSVSAHWDSYIGNATFSPSDDDSDEDTVQPSLRVETWQVLAVNKFDSTRKRMSVLVRAPEELGGVLLLFCKGADSAMLDPSICDLDDDAAVTSKANNDDFEAVSTLHLNAHLGEFASEGLRTLVLGVRVISESYGAEWLSRYTTASSSITNREKKLVDAAVEIETQLHIVGLTAIEDKLQKGVPETISKLSKAGIKLYVLTGDKRETAIEIGYSTKVLTPSMSLFQVAADGSHGGTLLSEADRVRTLIASEFLRLVKTGKLPEYQKKTLDSQSGAVKKDLRKFWVYFSRFWDCIGLIFSWIFCFPCKLFCNPKKSIVRTDERKGNSNGKVDINFEDIIERRKAVRKYAENIIAQYYESKCLSPVKRPILKETAIKVHTKSMATGAFSESDGVEVAVDTQIKSPDVFDRAASASATLRETYVKGPTSVSLRSLSLASVDSRELHTSEDVLSLKSFFPEDNVDVTWEKKRTIFEKLFAVDSDVRNGRLRKHSETTKRDLELIAEANNAPDDQGLEGFETSDEIEQPHADGHYTITVQPQHDTEQRALIIEGAALSHLMGTPVQDELLFSVASCFDSVIACRVSPKQKALLVRTVRTFVEPEPITLAIGDGANDVGMIQEAHVGVGISGLEGQQAVNSSDFSIAQFRFLEDLLLIHGRYNFSRMARVVLYSFYKNAVLATLLVVFSLQNLFSGTTLFDPWLISMFNFVCFFPIFFVGLFDRDFDKEYIRQNPQLYASGIHAEEMSLRKVSRWVVTTIMHLSLIYFLSIPVLSNGGTMSSAFSGLLRDSDKWLVGDGEGDYQSDGTAVYMVLVFTLAYKALFETKSIYNGSCPMCYCGFGPEKDPLWSRLPWTWLGVTVGSILFFLWATYLYQVLALYLPGLAAFIGVATHTFETRSLVWLIIFFTPFTAELSDVVLKVFGNMYFPTQTQIHMEAAQLQQAQRKKFGLPSFQIAKSIAPAGHPPGTQAVESL